MSLQEIETSLTRSLTTITTHWDHMLTPRSSGSIARGSTASVTLADDHADTDADTPRLERLLSLRREVTEGLVSWANIVMGDRGVRPMIRCTHGRTLAGPITLPWPMLGPLPDPGLICTLGRPWPTERTDGGWRTFVGEHSVDVDNVHELAKFLETNAQWLSGHDAAQDADTELRGWAGKIRTAAAAPEVGGDRDEIIIRTVNAGKCPVALNRGEHAIYGTPLMRCDTTVRLPLAQPEDTAVTCAGCGTEDTVEGWTARIIGNPEPLTTRALIAFLHERLGMTVTPIAVRLWQHKGMIEPLSKTESGHNLYDGYKVLRALRERDERRLGIHEETA